MTLETGLVKYELVQKDWLDPSTGKYWNRFSFIKGPKAKNREENILGVALLQMIEDRKVKTSTSQCGVASSKSLRCSVGDARRHFVVREIASSTGRTRGIRKRIVKVGVFPGKTAGQVSGFTDQDLIFER